MATGVKNSIAGRHMSNFFSIPGVYIDNRGQFLIPYFVYFLRILYRSGGGGQPFHGFLVCCCLSIWFRGGGHTRLWERGWEVPIQTRGQTLWFYRCIKKYMHFVEQLVLKICQTHFAKNPQNTEECVGDFWCVFPLSIDTGRTHVKSSKL